VKLITQLKTKLHSHFSPSSSILDKEEGLQQVSKRLRLLFLLPISLTFLLGAIIFSLLNKVNEVKHQEIQFHAIEHTISRLYFEAVEHHSEALLAVLDSLEYSTPLKDLFSQKKRIALYQKSLPLYNQLNQLLSVTHFYYLNPNKTVFLRLHAKQKFGDSINRSTLLNASKTGHASSGIELGPLGTLTLRAVKPWHQTGHLHTLPIGYLELGMEVDHIFAEISQVIGAEALVILDKSKLDKRTWSTGQQLLNRPHHWEDFPHITLGLGEISRLPTAITTCLKQSSFQQACQTLANDPNYRISTFPIRDIQGQIIAKALFIFDTRAFHHLALSIQIITLIAVSTGCVALFFLFYFLIGQVGKRIETDEREILRMATHDGLTQLYNHRSFYQILEAETQRAKRYNHPLTLIMIDIDHFKKVNDHYGHIAGDLVLTELSRVISAQTREIDKVCRYGGEEITLIMPELDYPGALEAAERIRKQVAKHAFNLVKLSLPSAIHITISLGVAIYNPKLEDTQALVCAADTALYQAKNSGRNCTRAAPPPDTP
jgi:diguanylate cyclase (GGDEF)-like protein